MRCHGAAWGVVVSDGRASSRPNPTADLAGAEKDTTMLTSAPRHRRTHRRYSFSVMLVAMLTAITPFVPTSQTGAVADTNLSGSTQSPIMFGASGSTRKLVETHERTLGTKLHGLRVYKNWDDTLFTSSQTWARDTGHTLFVSISSQRNSGAGIRWADIAAAQPGSPLYNDMQRQAQQIKAFRDEVYIAFNHEPEAESSWYGGPAQFVAAWRKLISIYRAAGVTNAKYVLTLTAWGFERNDGKNARFYYPGDSFVDYIAADGYNWYRCRSTTGQWRQLSSIIEAQRRFGMQHPDKGLMLWEFGSTEDASQPGRKAQWLHNAEALFKQPAYAQYKTVLTWEGRLYTQRSSGRCDFDYNSSTSARDAWKAMGTDPYYAANSVS